MLTALPSRPLAAALLACALVVVTSGTAVVTATTAVDSTARPATTTQSTGDTRPCDDAEYRPPDLDREWDAEFVDSLGTASQSDWTGGRVVRVGATGDCSLAVLDGETATLTATTVDGTRGVLTGTLDLGANGSLALVAANGLTGTDAPDTVATETDTVATETDTVATGTDAVSTSSAVTTATTAPATTTTTARTTGSPVRNRTARALVLSNDGPDFAPSVVVASGSRSTRVALGTGRFFDFAISRDDGAVTVAVWEAGETWDGQWDVRFANATGTAEWRVRLRGRAFLDGVAVGVGEAGRTPGTGDTGAADETPVGDGSDDDPFPREDPDPVQVTNGGPDGSGDGRGFYGVVIVVIGVVTFRYARGITRFGEQIDAIGSTTPMSEVEAADWNVALTKVISAILVVVGLGMLVSVVL